MYDHVCKPAPEDILNSIYGNLFQLISLTIQHCKQPLKLFFSLTECIHGYSNTQASYCLMFTELQVVVDVFSKSCCIFQLLHHFHYLVYRIHL